MPSRVEPISYSAHYYGGVKLICSERSEVCYASLMQALQDYMKVAGLSQAQLATRIGVDAGQLNHWLTKRRSPTVANLKLIAAKTGISLEKLAKDL